MKRKSARLPRNTKDGAIWFKEYPPVHAEAALKAGYYVEALQVLHAWLEVKLQEWLLLSRHNNSRIKTSEVWDTAFGFPLLQAAKALYVTGKMPKVTFESVCRFNSMRNKVIHRMFHEDYENGAAPIPFKDYKSAFDAGMKISDRLEIVLSNLAMRGKPKKQRFPDEAGG